MTDTGLPHHHPYTPDVCVCVCVCLSVYVCVCVCVLVCACVYTFIHTYMYNRNIIHPHTIHTPYTHHTTMKTPRTMQQEKMIFCFGSAHARAVPCLSSPVQLVVIAWFSLVSSDARAVPCLSGPQFSLVCSDSLVQLAVIPVKSRAPANADQFAQLTKISLLSKLSLLTCLSSPGHHQTQISLLSQQ